MFKNFKSDLPASIVVYFVAIPLCLGIALASGAPLFSGLIAGIIGGVVVGFISGSQVGVSGPAAGLAAIVLSAIVSLGSFETFLLAVVLGGLIQLILGLIKAGIIGFYFPNSVIKGMLVGIGLIIFLKQIPHFFGYDTTAEGEFAFLEVDGENTFSAISHTFSNISLGSTLVAIISLAILILWEQVLAKKGRFFQLIQGPLVVVVLGIIYTVVTNGNTQWEISDIHLVSVPEISSFQGLVSNFTFPDFSQIGRSEIWVLAFTIALVASLETLLCVEATDKLDTDKRITPKNRELIAQGVGNMFSGMIGGLPITQVIVRSSANIQSGGKTKLSAILHGLFIIISILLIPGLLNKIPLSVLAAILLIVGYKLAKPSLFKIMFKHGIPQFIPFIVTILGILFGDLLIGIGLGVVVGLLFILHDNFKNSHSITVLDDENGKKKYTIVFAEEMTFINKAPIFKELTKLPEGAEIEIDLSKTKYLGNDIVEILTDYFQNRDEKNIKLKIVSNDKVYNEPIDVYQVFASLKGGVVR